MFSPEEILALQQAEKDAESGAGSGLWLGVYPMKVSNIEVTTSRGGEEYLSVVLDSGFKSKAGDPRTLKINLMSNTTSREIFAKSLIDGFNLKLSTLIFPGITYQQLAQALLARIPRGTEVAVATKLGKPNDEGKRFPEIRYLAPIEKLEEARSKYVPKPDDVNFQNPTSLDAGAAATGTPPAARNNPPAQVPDGSDDLPF